MSTTTQEGATLSSYLSERMLELRVERDWTQEDVAARARAAGLHWIPTSVTKIERGRRYLTIEELFVLPAVFEVTLPELFDDNADGRALELGDECAATAAQLRQSLSGEWTLPVRANHEDSVPGPTERKAARRVSQVLGFDVSFETIMRLSQEKWGRSLSAERDARIAETVDLRDEWNRRMPPLGVKTMKPLSLRAMRVNMTRELIDELKPEIVKVRQRSRRAMAKEKKR